ncbi:hypothetical protein SLE2022_317490 [Rubroshorea leprosula]
MQEKFKYHSKCRVMQLTHLIFADDIMLFCKADEESTVLMMQKFEEFARVSGLEVNRMKSQVFFSGVREGQKVALIQKLGFAEGQLLVRYLGLPLISKKLSPGACQPIIDKIHQRIGSWATKFLSYAGRVQLVNSVLFHIEVFWSGALLIPKKVLKLIDATCRNFIWCGKWNYNAMSLVAWDDVCVPRKEGGLGLKQLLHWNKAALGKLVWNICQHQESLWVKWAHGVLLRGENFWKVKIPTDCAWTWRQVLKLRPLLKNIIWMQVGDGRQVSLFYDWWAGELRFCELISKDEIAVWGHDLTVSEWWDGLDWTIPDSFVRRHPMLVQIIRCQKLSQQVDKAIWKPAKNGLFTISSCYEFLRVKRPKVEWHRIVWAGCIFLRHRFIFWLVLRGRLKTRDLLTSRGMRIEKGCCLCGRYDETCEHLFFYCSFAKEEWRLVLDFLNIHRQPKRWSVE